MHTYPAEKRYNLETSTFRNWTVGKCYRFMDRWNALEENHAEQAALSITCEEFAVSYMNAEWVEIVEAIRRFEGKGASDGTIKK